MPSRSCSLSDLDPKLFAPGVTTAGKSEKELAKQEAVSGWPCEKSIYKALISVFLSLSCVVTADTSG